MPKPVTIGDEGIKKHQVEQLLSGWSQESFKNGQLKPLNDTYYAEIASTLAQSISADKILQQMIAMRNSIENEHDIKSFNYNASLLMTELLKSNPYDPAYIAIREYVLDQKNISKEHSSLLQQFNDLFPAKAGSSRVNFQSVFVPIVEEVRKKVEDDKKSQENLDLAVKAPTKSNEVFKHAMNQTRMSLSSKTLNKEVKKVAADLLTMHISLLNKIQTIEFLPSSIASTNNNIQKMADHFNKLSATVQDEIMLCTSARMQMNTYVFYVKLMDECIKNRDFFGAQAILGALEGSSVSRLKHLQIDKKVNAMLEGNKALLNNISSYANYRKAVASSDKPYIPMISVVLSDLTFIKDGNPSIRNDENENLIKTKLIADQIHPLQNVQMKLKQRAVTAIQTDILSRIESPHLSDNDAYKISLAIAPRPKSSSTPGEKPPKPIKPFSQHDLVAEARREAIQNLSSTEKVGEQTVAQSTPGQTQPSQTERPPVPPRRHRPVAQSQSVAQSTPGQTQALQTERPPVPPRRHRRDAENQSVAQPTPGQTQAPQKKETPPPLPPRPALSQLPSSAAKLNAQSTRRADPLIRSELKKLKDQSRKLAELAKQSTTAGPDDAAGLASQPSKKSGPR